MAESITEGTLAHFHKQIGDRVEVDEELASIETDKVDVSVSAPVAGVLAELLVALGDTVTTGQDVARIDTTAEPVATASQSSRVAAAKSSPAHSDSTADTEKMQSSTEQSSSERDANLVSQEQWRNKPLSDVIVPFPASNASTPASRVLEQPRPIESPNPQPRDSQAAMEIFPFRDERVVCWKTSRTGQIS
jgi:2-oxoglutarate dehydrogenase E2 component (dihydrolipoamide succinyltransferase)